MFANLVASPKRRSVATLLLTIVLTVVGFRLLRIPGWRLEAERGWLTPGLVHGAGLTLLTAAAFALLLGSLLVFPEAMVPDPFRPPPKRLEVADFMTAQNELRSTLVNAVAGLLLLLTAIFTWQQLVVSREAQVTERFTRATELLGDADPAVRVGAIHALGRLAVDSPADDRSIYQLLTAYVRDTSPRGLVALPKRRQRCEHLYADHGELGSLEKCATDVQAALTVLGEQPPVLSDGRPFQAVLLDTTLRGGLLGHARLGGADLRGARLDQVDCRSRTPPYTDLARADLTGASLRNARLGPASLAGAILAGAKLQDTWFGHANLANANLTGAKLQGARLEQANLQGAKLEGADLSGADLGRADLRSATYDHATAFPVGFDAVGRGMVADAEPGLLQAETG